MNKEGCEEKERGKNENRREEKQGREIRREEGDD